MNLDSVNQGIYPQKSYWNSPAEKRVFIGMILFSVVIYFQILGFYVYGGQ
jgi:hypothetical protein